MIRLESFFSWLEKHQIKCKSEATSISSSKIVSAFILTYTLLMSQKNIGVKLWIKSVIPLHEMMLPALWKIIECPIAK